MCLSGLCKQRERLRWGGSCFVMSDVVMISFDEESCNWQLGSQGGSQSRSTTVLVPGTCIGSLPVRIFQSSSVPFVLVVGFEGSVQVGSAPSASHPQEISFKGDRFAVASPRNRAASKRKNQGHLDRFDADCRQLAFGCTGATRYRDGGDCH